MFDKTISIDTDNNNIIDENIQYFAIFCKTNTFDNILLMLYDLRNKDYSYDSKIINCYKTIGYDKMLEIAEGLSLQLQTGGNVQKIDKYISSVNTNTGKIVDTADNLAMHADKLANTTEKLASSASKIINVFKKKKTPEDNNIETLKQIIITKDREIALLKKQLALKK